MTPAEREFLDRYERDTRWADYRVIRDLGEKLTCARDADRQSFEDFGVSLDIEPETAEKIIDAAVILRDPRLEMQAEIMARIERVAAGIAFHSTGLRLPDGLTYEQWCEVWNLLQAMPGFPAAKT